MARARAGGRRRGRGRINTRVSEIVGDLGQCRDLGGGFGGNGGGGRGAD